MCCAQSSGQHCLPLPSEPSLRKIYTRLLQGDTQTADLGQLLMGFFRRFGSHFNLYTDAVAIGSGGICPKKDVCQFEEDVLVPKLCIQDISTLRYTLVLLLC